MGEFQEKMSDGILQTTNAKHAEHASPFHSNILRDKVALVTGGGSGIGLQIALQLGMHGARVAIMGRTKEKLDQAKQFLQSEGVTRVVAVSGDVRDARSAKRTVDAVLEHFGTDGLDILVNNAAGNFLCLLEDLSLNAFKTVIDIDLNGTFNMSTSALEALKKAKGCVINITATLHYGATPYVGHASAAKAGVDALTRGLAVEWQPYGIRVNGIAPGPIGETEGMARLAPPPVRGDARSSVHKVKFGTKDDIALTAIFLCSRAANYISGETIVVDGTTWMQKPEMVPRDFYEKNIRKPKAKL